MTVLALDIGGTKVAAALVAPDGTLLRALRAPTGDDPWSVVTRLTDELVGPGPSSIEPSADRQDRPDVTAVGVGCAGPMSWPEGVVTPINLSAWRGGFPLRQRLAERFPDRPVRVHNDAVCVAVGEHWRGAGRGAENVLGMVVSTGVGGGLILGGRLVDGARGNAGHIGHVQVDPDGPVCGCGGRGCLESIARGPAVVAWARERGSVAADGRELAALAADGDLVARAALRRAGRATGLAVASAAALLDLSVVAIGGGLTLSGPAFWDPLRDAVRAQARLPFLSDLRVVPADLGQDAGLVGAAALVLGGERYWSAP